MLPESTDSHLKPSAQNNPRTKVAYLGEYIRIPFTPLLINVFLSEFSLRLAFMIACKRCSDCVG